MDCSINDNVAQKFWAQVDKTENCWIYSGGKFRFRGGDISGKRYSWITNYGDIVEKKMSVINICGNL